MQARILDHHRIIWLKKALAYPSDNSNGLCHGYVIMALQACHIQDYQSFAARLALLQSIDSEVSTKQFAQRIQAGLLNGTQLQDPSGTSLTATQSIDMMAFLEGIEVCQNIRDYASLTGKQLEQHHVDMYFDMISSKKLADLGGIKASEFVLRSLNFQELTEYFNFYSTIASENNCRFSLRLTNHHHTIALHYEPALAQWLLIDANINGITVKPNELHLAKWVQSALMEGGDIIFYPELILSGTDFNSENTFFRSISNFEAAIAHKNACDTSKVLGKNSAGYTPFMIAFNRNDERYFKCLYQSRQRARDHLSETLIIFYYQLLTSIATHYHDKDQQKRYTTCLEKSTVDYSIVDKDNNSLAHYASMNGNLELLLLLSEIGVCITSKNDAKLPPWYFACYYNSTVIIHYYLTIFNVDVNAVFDNGETFAMVAAKRGNIEMLEYLRINGVDLSNANTDGMTPAKYAIMHDQAATLAYLDANGVDLPISDMPNNLKTFAQEHGANNCILFLNEYKARILTHTPSLLSSMTGTMFSVNDKRIGSSCELHEPKRRCYCAVGDNS